jgi:hypothetical protein
MGDRWPAMSALGLALALMLAACGGASTATSAPASQAAAATAGAPTEAAMTDAPADTMAPVDTSGPDISLAPGAAGDLEAMLPSSIDGATFEKTSFDGAAIAGAGTPFDTSQIDPTLSQFGKSISDVKFALATSSAGSAVYALQVKGVPAKDFMGALGLDTTGMTQATVGGKSVYQQAAGGMSSIIYPKDDIVFMLIAVGDTQASSILSALP